MNVTQTIARIREERLLNMESRLVAVNAIAKLIPASTYVQQRDQVEAIIGQLKALQEAGNVFTIEELRVARQLGNKELK